MEHRWGKRVPLNISACLRCELFTTPSGIMRDASVSGAFIETSVLPPLYSRVHVKFSIAGERYDLLAYVTRYGRDGVGVEWAELAPPAICRQLRLSEKRAVPLCDRSTADPQSLAG